MIETALHVLDSLASDKKITIEGGSDVEDVESK
jgi:hypothetical protein